MPKMPSFVSQLEEQLTPYVNGTQTRFSKRGVPHLIVWVKNEVYSLCFFGSSKIWRLFHPYPSYGSSQTRKDFLTIEGVVNYFKTL